MGGSVSKNTGSRKPRQSGVFAFVSCGVGYARQDPLKLRSSDDGRNIKSKRGTKCRTYKLPGWKAEAPSKSARLRNASQTRLKKKAAPSERTFTWRSWMCQPRIMRRPALRWLNRNARREGSRRGSWDARFSRGLVFATHLHRLVNCIGGVVQGCGGAGRRGPSRGDGEASR